VNPEEHMPLISPLLEKYDVVLTQEDFDWYGELAKPLDVVNYHGRLRKDVTHRYRSKPHPGPEAVDLPEARMEQLQIGDGLGFLSRFPMADETRIPWIDCADGAADCLAMKGFSFQRMTLADGAEVDVYDLHLEAGGGEDDQLVQGKDVAQLQEYVLTHSKGHAVILAGDTNLHTDDEHPDGGGGADTKLWEDFLAATGLQDACVETDCPDTGRIDKVAFRSGDGVTLEAAAYDVPAERFKDSKGEDLSDHEPVVVTFHWSFGSD
jgi:endonuclease/exonuclease/phosphatase family metal-dependent hydrolase